MIHKRLQTIKINQNICYRVYLIHQNLTYSYIYNSIHSSIDYFKLIELKYKYKHKLNKMNKGAQTIDYQHYATFMRKALSGPEICKEDGTLNHIYFNTKKGFYWSEEHNQLLRHALVNHGMDWHKIKEQVFNNQKAEVEIQLRACLLFGVKQSSKITQKQLSQLSKTLAVKTTTKANGNSTKKK